MNDATTNTAGADGDNNSIPEDTKTFTQDDVNRIVGERLSKERAKLEGDIAKREQELQHKEFMLTAKGKLQEKGLPVELLDALNTTSPEAFDTALQVIEQQYKNKNQEAPGDVGTYLSPTGSVGNFARRSYSAGNADPLRGAMGLQ